MSKTYFVLVLALVAGCLSTEERSAFADRLGLIEKRVMTVLAAAEAKDITVEERDATLAVLEAERLQVLAELQMAKDKRVADIAGAVEETAPVIGQIVGSFWPPGILGAGLVAAIAGVVRRNYKRKEPQ